MILRGGAGPPGRALDIAVGPAGRIEAVGDAGTLDPAGHAVTDLTGLVVLPGMIDAHVHFQEPGREDWEGFDTGSAAAAAGGVTTVVDMPIDCEPPTVSAAAVRAKAAAAVRHSRVDVGIWGGLVPGSVTGLEAMADEGVVGFKAFACPSGWDAFPPVDERALSAGFAVGARLGLPVAVHCELERLGHTAESEVEAVRWAASLAATAGASLHVVHASAAEAVDEARRWPRVTVETCPHYLVLDDVSAGPFGRCHPPIRDAPNREELWRLLIDGRIDWVASDHSPCPPEQRHGWAGIDGAGLTLPLLLSAARLDLPTVARVTTAAARALRLPGKGAILPGYDADLAIIDPAATWRIGPETLWSKHRLSAFLGREVKGRVVATFVRGRQVFSVDEGPCASGGGTVIRPPRARGRTARRH